MLLRFMALFWIDDGFRLDARASAVRLSQRDSEGRVLGRVALADVESLNYEYLIDTIEKFAVLPAWTNRMVNEIFADGDVAAQDRFLARAAFHVDETALAAIAARCRGARAKPRVESLVLEGLSARLARTPRRYVSPRLAETFLGCLDASDPSDLGGTAIAEILRNLRKIEAGDRAAAVMRETVRRRAGDRAALADLFGEALPPDSRWWVRAVLRDGGLGDEQAADALTAVGAAACASGDGLLATAALEAAQTLGREAPGAALALGWLRLGAGDPAGAADAFARLGRQHLGGAIGAAWPVLDGAAWPGRPLPAGLFDALEPVGGWPRISVVTPSLNQGRFIEDTILSVLNQNYPNLQYIVVDGGSTDGTAAILARYADRVEAIVEPDSGQSDAINKGFRRADGQILAWLNSDDMHAPGALHMAALAHLRTGADVIAGSCIEHEERRLRLVNRPHAAPGALSAARLADIFNGWFAGEFFFQPEVFFTRAMFERVGAIDATLNYAMDYDLWLRFALAGARLETLGWPFAFFRRHPGQKTAAIGDAIEEQARVRARMAPVAPGPERSLRIDRRLQALGRSRRPTVAVLSKRRDKIFAGGTADELAAHAPVGVRIMFGANERTPGLAEADLVIHLVHVLDDLETIATIRRQREDRAVIGWFWDNHHHHFANYAVAEAVDVAIPGHAFCKDYLAGRESRMWEPLPLCATQWSRGDVGGWFETHGVADRSPALYGGFVDYHFEPARRRFLEAVTRLLPKHALRLLEENAMRAYFDRSEEDRFAEWCAHRTSLVLPLRRDLSQRVFDALLAGQIPLVPGEIEDFDTVIPPALQDSLPVMRFTMADPASAVAAQEAALAAFEAGGLAAARARHAFAREHHMFSARVNAIIARVLADAPPARGREAERAPGPALLRARPKLFIDAQHGLGNRLRAIASAAQIAQRSGRELVIVWRPDHHCDCRFDALFDYAGAVIEDDAPEAASARGAIVHNYMEAEPCGRKDAPIALDGDRDVYVRSAFVLNSPLTDWAGQNAFLRGLRPVEAVRALVEGVPGPFDLSVHVRMEGGRKDEGLPYESPTNWAARDHALIDQWRAKSQPSRFLARVDALVAEGSVGALFLAADSPEAYAAFAERYGDRMRRLERDRYDRSAGQLRYALADAILLGRAPRMLGSTWSSFSELAARLAPGEIKVEMSGTDF